MKDERENDLREKREAKDEDVSEKKRIPRSKEGRGM